MESITNIAFSTEMGHRGELLGVWGLIDSNGKWGGVPSRAKIAVGQLGVSGSGKYSSEPDS